MLDNGLFTSTCRFGLNKEILQTIYLNNFVEKKGKMGVAIYILGCSFEDNL